MMSSYNTSPDKQYQICIFGSENYMTCYNDTPAVSLPCPKSGWSMKLQESDTNTPQYTICQNENPAAGLTVDQDPKCLNDAYRFYDISLQEIEFPVSKRQLWTLDSQLERDSIPAFRVSGRKGSRWLLVAFRGCQDCILGLRQSPMMITQRQNQSGRLRKCSNSNSATKRTNRFSGAKC